MTPPFSARQLRVLAAGTTSALKPIFKRIDARVKALEAENRELRERVITLELRLLSAEERSARSDVVGVA